MAGLVSRLNLVEEQDRLVRFLVLGAANTAFAYGIYAAGLALGLSYQLASLGALIAAILSGFFLQGKLAFRTQLDKRFLPFLGLWTLLYVANIVIIGALNVFGINYYWAGLIAAVPVNAVSFLALRTLIFADTRARPLRLLIWWCLGLVAVGRLYVTTHLSLNWDEFLNLSMIYDFRRGEMTEIFQTAFIHLYRWLPYISDNEVDQIIAARILGLVCVASTSWAIYRSSRHFVDSNCALVSVLAFNCFGAAFLYGTDFRTDTLATAVMMAAVAIATRRRIDFIPVFALGVLIAIGGALTIKSIFFLPTIAVLLLTTTFGSNQCLRSVKILAAGAAVSLIVFALILGLHANGLQEQASALTFLHRTGTATLLTGNFTILSAYWQSALFANLGFWVLVVGGIVGIAKQKLQMGNRLRLSGFALPALVPLVYSEVYPYFHPFLVAPLSVLAGYGFSQFKPFSRILLCGLLVFSAGNSLLQRLDGDLANQRRTLALVHRLFPEPVPYIDHTSMVSSFPKRGFFMSRWGVSDYRSEGRPVMAEIIARDEPKFLLETRDLLAVDRIPPERSDQKEYGLYAEDVLSLRNNYQRYWGPLFLPGKALSGTGEVELEIGGDYRVEAGGPLELGGEPLQQGETIHLEPGSYTYSSAGPARLLWAAPRAPDSKPPDELFTGW